MFRRGRSPGRCRRRKRCGREHHAAAAIGSGAPGPRVRSQGVGMHRTGSRPPASVIQREKSSCAGGCTGTAVASDGGSRTGSTVTPPGGSVAAGMASVRLGGVSRGMLRRCGPCLGHAGCQQGADAGQGERKTRRTGGASFFTGRLQRQGCGSVRQRSEIAAVPADFSCEPQRTCLRGRGPTLSAD